MPCSRCSTKLRSKVLARTLRHHLTLLSSFLKPPQTKHKTSLRWPQWRLLLTQKIRWMPLVNSCLKIHRKGQLWRRHSVIETSPTRLAEKIYLRITRFLSTKDTLTTTLCPSSPLKIQITTGNMINSSITTSMIFQTIAWTTRTTNPRSTPLSFPSSSSCWTSGLRSARTIIDNPSPLIALATLRLLPWTHSTGKTLSRLSNSKTSSLSPRSKRRKARRRKRRRDS